VSFDDISKACESVLNLFLEWFDVCRNPLKYFLELTSVENEKEKIKKSLRLWFVSFLITLVLQVPVLKAVGIEWGNLGFHLPNFLLLMSAFMLTGVALHLGMRIYGINSNLADTLAGYSALVGCYSPIFAVVNYPGFLRILTSLHNAKVQHLSFFQAMALTLQDKGLNNPGLTVLSFAVMIGSYLLLAFMAHKMSEIYAVSRQKMLAAFGFAMAVLWLPVFGILALVYFTFYTFIVA